MGAKKVMVDLDDTSADFLGQFSAIEKVGQDDVTAMYEPGFFLRLKPVPGALKAIRDIMRMGYDVHFCTQPLAESAHSYQEKVQWVGLWFPELVNKIIMTQDKGLIRGDYLIDDNSTKWRDKWTASGQTFIWFEYTRNNAQANTRMWEDIVEFLRLERNRE